MTWKIGHKTQNTCTPCNKQTQTITFTRTLNIFETVLPRIHTNPFSTNTEQIRETRIRQIEADEKRALGAIYASRNVYR
jgi:hypothetical protein